MMITNETSTSKLETNPEPFFSEEAYENLVDDLKDFALNLAEQSKSKDWISSAIKSRRHLDGIISDLRDIPGGQVAGLEKLADKYPDMKWYRGGSQTTLRDNLGHDNYFSPEELKAPVIDSRANGVLGRPDVALNYAQKPDRHQALLYSVNIQDLITGVKSGSISLSSEKSYSTRIVPGKDLDAYLTFCRDHVHMRLLDKESS